MAINFSICTLVSFSPFISAANCQAGSGSCFVSNGRGRAAWQQSPRSTRSPGTGCRGSARRRATGGRRCYQGVELLPSGPGALRAAQCEQSDRLCRLGAAGAAGWRGPQIPQTGSSSSSSGWSPHSAQQDSGRRWRAHGLQNGQRISSPCWPVKQFSRKHHSKLLVSAISKNVRGSIHQPWEFIARCRTSVKKKISISWSQIWWIHSSTIFKMIFSLWIHHV